MDQKTFCHFCGASLKRKFIEGRQRLHCDACRRTIYENPIPATCVVVLDPDHHLLLVKRSVEPRKGLWCLPGGFIELGESPEDGALRELNEETGLSGRITCLLGIRSMSSTHYDGIMMVAYLVRQYQGTLVAGDDAQKVEWFSYEQLPAIAFDSHDYFIRKVFLSGNYI